MPNPHLSNASFPHLKKTGKSYGTITASDIGTGDPVHIETKNGKKKWRGQVDTLASPPSTWNAWVENYEWREDDERVVETVTVTVSNLSGPSNPVDTTSDIP